MKTTFSKLFVTSLFVTTLNAQVGVNTIHPTETLDINGRLRVRDIASVNTTNYILIPSNDGVLQKIELSEFVKIIKTQLTETNNDKCPTIDWSKSNPYSLHFTSLSAIANPNASILVDGKTFASAGTYINNNTFVYSYSNVSGTPMTASKFTIDFGMSCTYDKGK